MSPIMTGSPLLPEYVASGEGLAGDIGTPLGYPVLGKDGLMGGDIGA